MERVCAFKNCFYPSRFTGHGAFAWQTPDDVFAHDGTQQVAIAIAKCADEVLRDGLFVLLCHFVLPGKCRFRRCKEWIDQNIVFSFSDVFGMAWMTSQCSTTLPSSTRKMSMMASPFSPKKPVYWQ